jgi:hypothetical protein
MGSSREPLGPTTKVDADVRRREGTGTARSNGVGRPKAPPGDEFPRLVGRKTR